MKERTLDEVIRALNYCMKDEPFCDADCPLVGSCSPTCYALKYHAEKYLKEYQAKTQRLVEEISRYQEAVKNCEEAENKYKYELENFKLSRDDENHELTWKELEVGTPVYVIGKTGSHWEIPSRIYYNDLNIGFVVMAYVTNDKANSVVRKSNRMNDTWKAYRRKPEENRPHDNGKRESIERVVNEDDDLISRSKAIEYIKEHGDLVGNHTPLYQLAHRHIIEVIKTVPSVNVVYQKSEKTLHKNDSVTEMENKDVCASKAESNEPLEWIDFYEGQKIWIESDDYKGWAVVFSVYETDDDTLGCLDTYDTNYYLDEMGSVWTAYREERK